MLSLIVTGTPRSGESGARPRLASLPSSSRALERASPCLPEKTVTKALSLLVVRVDVREFVFGPLLAGDVSGEEPFMERRY